uniref:Uncharacterized protein n=1 Tax=Anguilla anguilla TaxID=7936 RepID=A0A0E9QER0_ANGAN
MCVGLCTSLSVCACVYLSEQCFGEMTYFCMLVSGC